MCDKAIPENDGTLKYVHYCYKNQEMYNKGVENYPHVLEFVSECYNTQEICDKALNTQLSTIKFVPECFMTEKVCDKADIDTFLYIIPFLINTKLKNCVALLFLKTLL